MDPTPVLRARGGRGAPKARRARCGRRAAGRQPTADLAGGAWDKWQSATRAQLARRRRSHTSLHTRLQRLVWADRRRICVLGGKSDLSNILYFAFSPDPRALGAWAIRTGHGTCRWTEKSTMHRVCRSKIAVRRNLDFPESVQNFGG